jgi:hypothetical protein
MWPIQLASLPVPVCQVFLSSFTLCYNTSSFVTRSAQLIFFIHHQHHIGVKIYFFHLPAFICEADHIVKHYLCAYHTPSVCGVTLLTYHYSICSPSASRCAPPVPHEGIQAKLKFADWNELLIKKLLSFAFILPLARIIARGSLTSLPSQANDRLIHVVMMGD